MLLRRILPALRLGFCSSYGSSMYTAWRKDPNSVHPDWDRYFKLAPTAASGTKQESSIELEREKRLVSSAYKLIRDYTNRGHEKSVLDPLRLENFREYGKIYAENRLENERHQENILKNEQIDVPFTFPHDNVFLERVSGFLKERPTWTLRQLKERLEQIYTNKICYEFMHICDLEQTAWFRSEFEALSLRKRSNQQKLKILKELAKVEGLNYFLNEKLKTSKRFGVQGLDSMIAGTNSLIEYAAQLGVQYVGVGMAHRGRLNALANIFNKPLQKIFSEFQEYLQEDNWGNSGDVKYHLGTTTERDINGKKIRLTILPNPSHLEAVNPVVMGHVKAVEEALQNGDKSLGVLFHGDAALAGQGIVYECLQMSYLNNYNIKGMVHVVANNQIGFTTTPAEARTSLYCTDVGKAIQAPIIHVNADEPELVVEAMEIALRYRQKFHRDIFVDVIGYRRYGHNEQDQPAFTQPMMYQVIGQRKNIYSLYSDQLVSEGVITREELKSNWDQQIAKINEAYYESAKSTFDIKKWQSPAYYRPVDYNALGEVKKTGLDADILQDIGKKLCHIPTGFNINPQIKKIYEAREKSIVTGQGIDFGTAESLAFGSLLQEGFNVRLVGQDVERGTFSHRHAVVVDQVSDKKHMFLSTLLKSGDTKHCHIENSILSEYGALGFEYGYSITNPNTLVIWEAQFGDFANGAQTIIDNFLSSGESKWGVQNGLVMNLPHGMDGQGPEHSSGRMERFLQLASDDVSSLSRDAIESESYKPIKNCNMQIVCSSNASSHFHVLRRQMRRDYRKPLINFVSKKLLKLKDAATNMVDLAQPRYLTILGESDTTIEPLGVKKVVILSGQAYYSALEKRTELGIKDVAFIRLEQLAPFHYRQLAPEIEQYPNAEQFIWFQEEHRNSGAWSFVAPRISFVLEMLAKGGKIKHTALDCVSRRSSASTAVGKKKKHDVEQAEILKQLFGK